MTKEERMQLFFHVNAISFFPWKKKEATTNKEFYALTDRSKLLEKKKK